VLAVLAMIDLVLKEQVFEELALRDLALNEL
jgi:hypothetical protein